VQTVARWLEQQRPDVVAQLVQRIYEELPDYRQRPAEQLAPAAGAAYDQWRTTVLDNDLMRYAREAEAVIAQNIARGTDPTQLARVPLLISTVVLAMLAKAGPEVNPTERALFQERAQRMTARILGIGGLRIAQGVLKKAVGESFALDPENQPGS
jgi:hypothetical protein